MHQPQLHERFLGAVIAERERLGSRRAFLNRSAKLAAGGTLAGAFAAAPVSGMRSTLAQAFTDDLDIFNYALTLEHLEYAFYRDGLQTFGPGDFTAAGFAAVVYDYFGLIRDHENAHVNTITATIADAGGTPVGEAQYDFGYGNDVTKFAATAQALENTGVAAYTGAAPSISDPGLLTAALTVQGVEARHASYLNLLNGDVPFPDAFDAGKTRSEILAIAGPFIVGRVTTMPNTGSGTSCVSDPATCQGA